ncbi:glycolate oxidase subunit GlcF [Rhodovulum sp. DZ06]|uniref:glycolate oxidase subunit GlcF n=1 Tax=Rhodovulum sp. DZ06 TaxID=3425126 RepID=UPI003D33416B
MQTNFTPEQLQDPGIARSNKILRSCVHCGFCTATCPTYQVLGDELDSPRGRIYLIKEMLETGRPADAKTVKHVDRCLGCLACMSTCPSGVDYMHLLDHARAHIEKTWKRPLYDRVLRGVLAAILPYPTRFRVAILGAWAARPFRKAMPRELRAMVEMAPRDLPPPSLFDQPQVIPAQGERKRRVALMTGCAQKALDTEINEATIRLLTRHGCEVVIAEGAGCCGALTHHMGKADSSHAFAKANIKAWTREIDGEGLDAVVINASGCGTTVKDYGVMFEDTPYERKAQKIAAMTRDITEFMEEIGLGPVAEDAGAKGLRVGYHAACSLQHGQKVTAAPKRLLKQAGFEVAEPADPHLCCGSAGTYNLLQPEIAGQLQDRKVATLEAVNPDVISAGNIGCMVQIGAKAGAPVVHTAQLLDWATGGPVPPALAGG